MLKNKRIKVGITLLLATLLIVGIAITLAVFTDRVSHSMKFSTATFSADGYSLTRVAPEGPFVAGENVRLTIKESNTGDTAVRSSITMTTKWTSPDTAFSIFGNASASDNAAISLTPNTAIPYTVNDNGTITYVLPDHILNPGAKDQSRELILHIPESFKSTGDIDFSFDKVVLKQQPNGFSKEFNHDELNKSETLDFGVNVGWAASNMTDSTSTPNGHKALMGYLTEKDGNGLYGIDFKLEYKYDESAMKDFASKTEAKWSYYKDSVNKLTFVEGMTSIGDYAFPEFSKVTAVSFPSTVESIGTSAFDGSGLTGEVSIPASVTNIESLAFGNLPKVKTFTFKHTKNNLTLPDNTSSGNTTKGAFYVPSHVDTVVNSTVEEIMYGYRWHDGWDNRRFIPMLATQDTWYTTSNNISNVNRNQITSIDIVDRYTSSDADFSWDASDTTVPGTVTAYLEDDGTGAGTYKLTIAGNGYGLVRANSDSSCAFGVKFFGSTWEADRFSSVKTFNGLDILDTTDVTTMGFMFTTLSSVEELDVSSFDTDGVTSMQYMFYGCNVEPKGVEDFETKTVTSMRNMFVGVDNLTLDLSGWDTSKVTKMDSMFNSCKNLNLNLTGLTTGTNATLESMFESAEISQLNLTNFNTTNVTNMDSMFRYTSGVDTVNLGSFNTAKVTDMTGMFEGSKFTTIDVTGFNTAKVQYMSEMFAFASNISELDLSSFDTSSVTSADDLVDVLDGCSALETLIIGENIKDFTMFQPRSLNKLTTIVFNHSEDDTELVFPTAGSSNGAFYNIKGTVSNPLRTKVVTDNSAVLNYDWKTDRRGYTITVKSATGGSINASATTSINGKTITLTVAANSGYEYTGSTVSYTDTNGTDKKISLNADKLTFTMPTGDVVITPKWEAVPPTLAAGDTWYRGITLGRAAITTINIVDTYTPIGSETESWDASASKNRSVMCYLNGTELTIAGNGSGKIHVYSGGSDFTFAKVTSINGLEFLDTSSVTDMSGMFGSCQGLTSLDLSSFNTSNVTNMANMFSGCYSLTEINLSSFNTSNVTNMYGMFNDCAKLTELDLSSFNTSNVTNMYRMFRECQGLTSLDLSSFNTSNVTDMSYMFNYCQGLTSLDLSSFDTSNVTNMSGMFSSCKALTELDLSSFDTSKVTKMDSMFNSCKALTELDLSSFNTSNVTNMGSMFGYCQGLTSLDLSSFNTSNVTNMGDMFSNCQGLTSLDLSSFNTSNVTDMYHMFNNCSSLITIYASSDFTTLSVENTIPMFSSCYSIVGGNGTKFGSITATFARIDTASTPGYFTAKSATLTLNVNSNGAVTGFNVSE